jgi:hypothetical protein
MNDVITHLRAVPATTLGAPGRALLETLLHLNAGWQVDIVNIAGEWFLQEHDEQQAITITPIEIFELEDAPNFF